MDFRRPQIGGIVQTWRGLEDELGLGLVPVGQNIASIERDVLVVGVGHVVVAIMTKNPSNAVNSRLAFRIDLNLRISPHSLQDGVGESCRRIWRGLVLAGTNSCNGCGEQNLEHIALEGSTG